MGEILMMKLRTESMPSLAKSLQKRIEELRSSLESQQAELTAYEKVLEIEVGRKDLSAHSPQPARGDDQSNQDGGQQAKSTAPEPTGTDTEMQAATSGTAARLNVGRESEAAASPEFTGNKTALVRALVEGRGSLGATPKDINDIFTARKIGRGKNFIYHALSVFVKQKELQKKDGRYFSASTEFHGKPKRRISPEGIKSIVAANKKGAERRAAENGRAHIAPRTSQKRKKAARPR